MPVAVVTDSTAYLPEATLAAVGPLSVVPLTVVIGDRTGQEGIQIGHAEVARALSSGVRPVTTSRPAPAEFTQVYSDLLASGYKSIISVHLSGKLSGTVEAARLAAAPFGDQIMVVDSESVAMGLGFPVLAAVRAAADGKHLVEVRDAVATAMANTTTLFLVETMEYLRRGGRIGAAAALLGTALAVKPILRMSSGGIVVSDRVRTTGKALARLTDLAAQCAVARPRSGESEGDSGRVRIAVHHLAAAQRAESIAEVLRQRLGDQVASCQVTEVGATVAAHTGPGLVGVVVHIPQLFHKPAN